MVSDDVTWSAVVGADVNNVQFGMFVSFRLQAKGLLGGHEYWRVVSEGRTTEVVEEWTGTQGQVWMDRVPRSVG